MLKDVDKLRDFAPLLGFVAAGYGVLDAMRDMVAKNFLLDSPKRRPDGRNLRHDIDAIAVFFDHANDSADLSLDPAKALCTRSFRLILHDVLDTVPGYTPQAA
jgi:hypothetical protein